MTACHIQGTILNAILLKKFVFENAPKQWFAYLGKYLYFRLQDSKTSINLLDVPIILKTETF